MFPFKSQFSHKTVAVAIAIGAAIAVLSFGIVRAEHISPLGSVKYTCSTGTACVTGDSSGYKTWGVYGTAIQLDGVHGTTNSTIGHAGVGGLSTSGSGSGLGVFGGSNNGTGVYGTTSSTLGGNGVEGHITSSVGASTQSGVAGYGGSGFTGVSGTGFNGVYGETSGNFGSFVGSAVTAVSDSVAGDIFVGSTKGTTHKCVIDGKANLTCTGDIIGGPVLVRRANSDGRRVLSYASESASATIEDVGTARMFGGVANVKIDPSFASVTDHKWYYVFLTPLGDTRGLYVSMKMASGFQVRENERGRSSLMFDYRIVAHPLDADNERLPSAPDMNRIVKVMAPKQ